MRSLVLASISVACGSDDGPPQEQLDPIDGPFVQVFGSQQLSFSIDPAEASVVCTPKPGLREFEFIATSREQQRFRFLLKGFAGPGTLKMQYAVTNPQHEVELELTGGFKYHFFQHLRADQNEIYNTHCDLTLEADSRQPARTRFSGHISCILLWAHVDSTDYAGTSLLNSFVDLAARIECET